MGFIIIVFHLILMKFTLFHLFVKVYKDVSLISEFLFQIIRNMDRKIMVSEEFVSDYSEYHSGSDPRPGEISLAHNGVLFLDELPEFDRKVLEVLREPLESGEIHISRAARQAVYPANFQLVAAMNPCPCGYLGHPAKPCRCTPDSIARYRGKISGPLLDRIDLTIEVPALSAAELSGHEAGESSAVVLARVEKARCRQYERQGKINARLSVTELDSIAAINEEAKKALGELLEKLSLSARSYHRIMRVARTLADLAGDEQVLRSHVLRAVSFRRAL